VKGFTYVFDAKETVWNEIKFRSRLEATWAAFFSECFGPHSWEYEPLDLKGWTPDFVLHLHEPVFVEIKPLLGGPDRWDRGIIRSFQQHCAIALNEDTRAMLCGSSIVPGFVPRGEAFGVWEIGLGRGKGAGVEDVINVGDCGGSQKCSAGLSPSVGDYACWTCGRENNDPAHIPPGSYRGQRLEQAWAKAVEQTRTTYKKR
jgi:hypothetical protein